MDNPRRSFRVRFSGLEAGQDDQKEMIPALSQKNGSSQGKKGGFDENGGVVEIAIGAAAFAIAAQEEERMMKQQKAAEQLNENKRKLDESRKSAGSFKFPAFLSGKDRKDDDQPSSNISVRGPPQSLSDIRTLEDIPPKQKSQDKATDAPRTPRKVPSFSFNNRDDKAGKKTEAIPRVPSFVGPRALGAGKGNENAIFHQELTKADAWERAKMVKIKEEYDNMISTIAEWETEKKVKARNKKDQEEAELTRRRAKALEEYEIEIERINKIAGGARSMAEEKKKNEEMKAREKANKMRITGKGSKTCGCF